MTVLLIQRENREHEVGQKSYSETLHGLDSVGMHNNASHVCMFVCFKNTREYSSNIFTAKNTWKEMSKIKNLMAKNISSEI